MKTKSFLASAAKAAFALAAVVMMSAVFTSCSKDDDDDEKKFTNTVILDGTNKPIVKAEYEDEGNDNYSLYLYLSADLKEKVILCLNKDLHMTGSPVNLAEKEKKHEGKWYWVVQYYTAGSTELIETFGKPGSSKPVFKTGTLTMSSSSGENINIQLENGRVKANDNNEHTLAINYSGTMTKV